MLMKTNWNVIAFLIYLCCHLQAQELGNPKGKKPKDIPLNIEVCEACKPYLDANEEIPLALLAKLIKYKLLDLKQKDLNRRDAEKKVGVTIIY